MACRRLGRWARRRRPTAPHPPDDRKRADANRSPEDRQPLPRKPWPFTKKPRGYGPLSLSSKARVYVLDAEKGIFEEAPRFAARSDPVLDRVMAEEIHDYYGMAYPYA